MNSDKVEDIIQKLEKRANSYARGASAGFFLVLLILIGLANSFYNIGFPEANDSNIQFGIEVIFNLVLKISLVVFSFYFIKIQMSVVSYNLALSNDLYAKSEALALYLPDGKNSLNDLYQHLSVNDHKFGSSKDFSGAEEFNNLISAFKMASSESNNSSKKGGV